jgi:hypothetical protein
MKVLTLTLVHEFHGGWDDEIADLVDEANRVLLTMATKLTESHPLPLYVNLREWRGDVVSEQEDEEGRLKRRPLWSLSAVLGSELGAKFLSCLSTFL